MSPGRHGRLVDGELRRPDLETALTVIVAEPAQERDAGALARVTDEPGDLSGREVGHLCAPPVELEPRDGDHE